MSRSGREKDQEKKLQENKTTTDERVICIQCLPADSTHYLVTRATGDIRLELVAAVRDPTKSFLPWAAAAVAVAHKQAPFDSADHRSAS